MSELDKDKNVKGEVGLLVGFFLFVLFFRVRPSINEDEVQRGLLEALGLGLIRAAFWGFIAALLHLLITKCLLRGMA